MNGEQNLAEERIVLHRCPVGFLPFGFHTCHTVQRALDEQGIAYTVTKVPLSKKKRARVIELTNQPVVPAIEFADGAAYRENGKEMEAEIRAGRLFEHRGDVPSG
jgi:glutaredoxin